MYIFALCQTEADNSPIRHQQEQGLTSGGAVALVADLPQAVQALVDTPQPVLQLTVLAAQGLTLDVAHVRGTEEVLITFCGVDETQNV